MLAPFHNRAYRKIAMLFALAILVARRFGNELKAHMRYALNIGLSRDEILEIILHTANYTCWGAGVEATRAGKEILGTVL